jgi:A/G-specific adenine glycosylase
MKKRDSRDIWRHLYDFYLIEKTVPTDPMQLLDEPFFRSLAKQGKPKVLNISVEYQHQLTHQRIHARFIRLFVDKKIFVPEQNRLILVGLNELINYPVPRLIERYLEEQALIKG